MEACALDPLFWINLFGLQSNPRHRIHKVGPFITRKYQDEGIKDIIRCVFIDGEDFGIDKSREEGASWAAVFIFLWACLFHHNEHTCAVSHTEKAVDNGPADSKSLFWKARFILKHLPDWMSRGYITGKLTLEFPATGSSFIGEACTGRTSVGGRGPCLLDEFAKMVKADEIWSNTADVGPRLVISTHYPTREGAEFARVIDRPSLRKARWHWSMNEEKARGLYRVRDKDTAPDLLDPDFNYENYPFVLDVSPGGPFQGLRSQWYDKEDLKRRRRDMAIHLDMNRSGSAAQFFDATIIKELKLKYATHARWEGAVSYDKATGKFLELMPRKGGPLRLWLPLDYHGRVNPGKFTIGCDVAEGTGKTPSCLSIIDAVLCHKVGEFSHAGLSSYDFAVMASAIGWFFSNEAGDPATICWETNGPGGKFGRTLVEDMRYPGAYRRWLKPPEVPKPRLSDTPGWHSGKGSKRNLLEDFREAFETKRLIVRSASTYDDAIKFRFAKKSDLVEHSDEVDSEDGSEAGENHSDMLIADAISWLVCKNIGSGVRAIERAKEIPVGSRLWRDEYRRHQDEAANSSWVEI